MIKAVFFSKFLTREGPRVIHQVPEGAIVPSPGATQPPLFNFSNVSEYIIPRQEFCDRLVTVCANHHRILGYPVWISSRKYDRNQLIFNFSIVLEESADISSYRSVVRKLAKLFRSLEEQGEFVSRDCSTNGPGGGGRLYALCEMILEDLNNYCECMIPIDESNTLNIKLFPTYPPPPPVEAWHVPLSTVRLESLVDVNWDLTMRRVLPHINGINSVALIAELADSDLSLTKKALSHLLYYGCLFLLDIFQFSAIYAPTASILALVNDPSMQAECARYITVPPPGPLTTSPGDTSLDPVTIIGLYMSLKQGQPLKHWCMEHALLLHAVDVRRFITFGIIKGFLYRVHKYAIASNPADATPIQPALDRGSQTAGLGGLAPGGDLPLKKFLDGRHCFDQICTELQLSERELLTKLKAYGDVQIVHR
ncbi:nitrogen permease regulator 2 [Xylona heveae TC161]|uniref:Nitrogen permease regulator 2 n=1 Tax=Xylona heveae (strain CBS 132557 / TC161) TaxID=1328760 RepID=A0A165GD83_XYLHT|nr:nitrogen permease regulator 2 [Xylona heveae TC161]KZF22050.1 nitrogen permease regulator 2 [Xylona heveae TC161]